MKRARWLGILGILAGSMALSLVAGEILFRIFVPREYKSPMLCLPGEQKQVPASEIYFFMRSLRDRERMGAGAAFRPYLFLKGWYDRPSWDYFDEDGCVDYLFNRFGFRDHDFEMKKKQGEYRIMALGDSFTLGVGVQLEHCWTEVLEKKLAQFLARPVEVINAGFAAGHQPVMYEEWIKSDAMAFEPDGVIIGMCVNDMHPNIELLARIPPVIHKPWLGGYSRMLYRLQKYLAESKMPKEGVRDFSARVRADPEPWNQVKEALISTKSFLDARGVRFIVVFLPALSGLRGEYPYAKLFQMAREFCEEEQIEYMDLLDRFLGCIDEEFWVHPTDQHPNPAGHRMIGEGIFEYLSRK
ncbi:MAG: SGNH/GDSL hydrolase family protein [Planctomycetota bacterium]